MNFEFIEQCERIYQRNRNKVVVGQKSGNELISEIKGFIDLEEAPLLEYYSSRSLQEYDKMLRHVFESHDYLRNKDRKFKLFRVVRNEKSEQYYQDANILFDDVLYLLLEIQLGWCQTVSEKLGSDIARIRGIEQEDLKKRGLEFVTYMMNSFPEDDDNPIKNIMR